MSLFIHNGASDKQKAFLEKLGYIGSGKYALENLSFTEASDLIEELIEEQRLNQVGMDDDMYGYWD